MFNFKGEFRLENLIPEFMYDARSKFFFEYRENQKSTIICLLS